MSDLTKSKKYEMTHEEREGDVDLWESPVEDKSLIRYRERSLIHNP